MVDDQDMAVPRLFTPAEVAKRQRVSLSLVKRALRAGLLHGHRVGSRGDWRISFQDEQAWVRAGAPSVPKPAPPSAADHSAGTSKEAPHGHQ
jgi:excisionase family DNA binding protein